MPPKALKTSHTVRGEKQKERRGGTRGEQGGGGEVRG